MDILSYVRPEMGVLIAVLYAIGLFLKKNESVKDKWIPLLLGAAGIVLGLLYTLGTSVLDSPAAWFSAAFSGVSQGVLCACGAVYANQLYKQARKDE